MILYYTECIISKLFKLIYFLYSCSNFFVSDNKSFNSRLVLVELQTLPGPMTNILNFEKKMEQNLKFGQHLEHLFPNKVPTFLISRRFSNDMLRQNDNIVHNIPAQSEKHCSRFDKSF